MRALVTGGHGYLGRHVTAALREAGHTVRVLDRIRREDSLVEQVQTDLLTDEHLERAFDGVDVLIHLAASLQGDEQQVIDNTVEGTRRLLEAMSRTPCRRLVLAGSLSVYDWSQVGGRLDEHCPVLRENTMQPLDAYARAKVLQEWLVRDKTVEHDWLLTVLRPTVLCGDGVSGAFVLGKRIGPVQLVIGPSAPARLVHVDNAALAFVRAAEREAGDELILNVMDDPQLTRWRYARRIGGLPVPVPYRAAMMLARCASCLTRRSTRLPYFLQPRRLESLHKPVTWSNDRLRKALDWSPRVELREAADA